MSRRARLLVGLVLLFGVAPVVALLWPTAADPEPTGGCGLGALANGMNLTFDFTGIFVAAGVGIVGVLFAISAAFRRMPSLAQPQDHRAIRLATGLLLALLVAPLVLGVAWLAGHTMSSIWWAQAAVIAAVGLGLCASAARPAISR